MRSRAILAALAATTFHGATAKSLRRQDDDLASRIEAENKIALQGVLNNFGPDGSQAPGASSGVLIASPSTENPNCKLVSDISGNLLLN
jgi:glucoamylase